MGDRGNIKVIQNPYPVYLYTHYSGSHIQEIARVALSRRWRWNDPAYLTRIIFDELTKDEHGEETGYGISTRIEDNEHPIVVIDPQNQRVWLEDVNEQTISKCLFFDEFLHLDFEMLG